VGILRIADGLDRDHRQSVHGVTVHAESDYVRFEVLCDDKPQVQIHGAARKADVFESAFHVGTAFSWTPPHTKDRRDRRRREMTAP
jgi:exopolyphosphatase/guanosine-5'-triphosphate,3'-diphosphate pyrophosphatase